MPESAKKTISNNYGGFIKAELIAVNAGLMKFDLLLYCCMPGRYCLKFSFRRNNV